MKTQRGFTLFELSIVIVIIALIIGGIILGAALTRAAQLRSTVAEIEGFKQMIVDFRDKYHAYPGDFSEAETIWGSDTSCPGTPTNSIPKTTTCNGDGDGHISPFTVLASADGTENFRAWQHLANAGFLPTTFTGVSGPTSLYDTRPGLNSPVTRLEGGAYFLNHVLLPLGDTITFPINSLNILVGSPENSSYYPDQPIVSATEAMSMDQKIDDGFPGTGKMIVPKFLGGSYCATTDSEITAIYDISQGSSITCSFRVLVPE